MYSEISKEAFNTLLGDNDIPFKVEELELCQKRHYLRDKVFLLEIYNYVSSVFQYYIQDINS